MYGVESVTEVFCILLTILADLSSWHTTDLMNFCAADRHCGKEPGDKWSDVGASAWAGAVPLMASGAQQGSGALYLSGLAPCHKCNFSV